MLRKARYSTVHAERGHGNMKSQSLRPEYDVELP